ncbi:MAG: SURF1 family protein, partial [Gammaproteobacteria bacterium]|nr:SURF1 family protein [Gammaproteobacteria bacterium]
RPLAAASDMARARAYDWAAGSGVFVDAPVVLLDNQQRGGRAGVRVYRVFAPTQGAAMLVELGWLPLPGARRMPDVPRPQGPMRIEGLLAPRPSHGIASAIAVPQANGALLTIGLEAANLNQALRQHQLAPRVLKLDPALPLGYARDLDVLPNTLPPARHLGYAVQWFALALAVLVTAVVLSLRKPTSKRPSP